MIPRHGLLGGSRPVAAEPLQSLARALPTFTICTCAMRLRCAPLTYELLWRVAQTLLTRADLPSRIQVRGVITFCSHAGKEQALISCTRPSPSAATPDGPALPAYLLERGKPADDAVTEEESSGEDSSSGDSDDDGKDDHVTSTVK